MHELDFSKAIRSLNEYLAIKKLNGRIEKKRSGIIPLTTKPFLQKDHDPYP